MAEIKGLPVEKAAGSPSDRLAQKLIWSPFGCHKQIRRFGLSGNCGSIIAKPLSIQRNTKIDLIMEKNTIINGAEIQNLITKFYYKNNNLCFQILLHLGVEKTIPFQEFTDYKEYKKMYSHLMNVKTTNSQVELPKNNLILSNMGLV